MAKTEWITPCNPTKYDIDSELPVSGEIYWRQNANYNVGDIVYIYLSAGISAIRYKTQVEEIDVNAVDIDEPYWIDKSMQSSNPKRMVRRLDFHHAQGQKTKNRRNRHFRYYNRPGNR